MKKRVILISGYKRSGKDFIAHSLQKLIPSSVILSFATPLKDIVATTFGISVEFLEVLKNNETPIMYKNNTITFRKILQNFGTEAMKPIFGDSIWAQLLLMEVKYNSATTVIVPDWRFRIEKEVLEKECDIITMRVVGAINTTKDTHASETELTEEQVDFEIDNSKKDVSVHKKLCEIVKGELHVVK